MIQIQFDFADEHNSRVGRRPELLFRWYTVYMIIIMNYFSLIIIITIITEFPKRSESEDEDVDGSGQWPL